MKPKRIVLLLLLVLVIVGVVNYMGNQQKPTFKGVSALQVKPMGNNGYRYTGIIEVYNPSIFQLRLSAIDLYFSLNGISVGQITNPINFDIASKATKGFPFEIRFEKNSLEMKANEPVSAYFKGTFSNSSLFSKLSMEIDTTETFSIQ